MIEECSEYRSKWRRAHWLFKNKWNISFTPSKSALAALELVHIYRNALVHNNGRIREKDIKLAKYNKIKDNQVTLTRAYVDATFKLIKGIVSHLDALVVKKLKKMTD